MDTKLVLRASFIIDTPEQHFSIHEDGSLSIDGQWCIPDGLQLRQHIIGEDHNSTYYIHPGKEKLYNNLRRSFFVARYEA